MFEDVKQSVNGHEVRLKLLEERLEQYENERHEWGTALANLADSLGFEYVPENTKTIKAHWKKIGGKRGKS